MAEEIKKPEEDKKQEGEVIRLSVSEAARLFGVSTQTIRRAIQLKEIIYIVVAGRYKINFESLVKWSQEKTTVRNKLANEGIGQYVAQWKIRNTLYSPNPNKLKKKVAKTTPVAPPQPQQQSIPPVQ